MIIKTALNEKVNSRVEGSSLIHILSKNSHPECTKNL